MARKRTDRERVLSYMLQANQDVLDQLVEDVRVIKALHASREPKQPASMVPKRKPGRPRKVGAGKAAEVGTEHVLIVPNKSQP